MSWRESGREELMRLKDKLEELAEYENVKPEKLRQRWFLDLHSYTNVLDFRKQKVVLGREVEGLRKETDVLERENANLLKAIKDIENISNEALASAAGIQGF